MAADVADEDDVATYVAVVDDIAADVADAADEINSITPG